MEGGRGPKTINKICIEWVWVWVWVARVLHVLFKCDGEPIMADKKEITNYSSLEYSPIFIGSHYCRRFYYIISENSLFLRNGKIIFNR